MTKISRAELTMSRSCARSQSPRSAPAASASGALVGRKYGPRADARFSRRTPLEPGACLATKAIVRGRRLAAQRGTRGSTEAGPTRVGGGGAPPPPPHRGGAPGGGERPAAAPDPPSAPPPAPP